MVTTATPLRTDIAEAKRAAALLCDGVTELRILAGRKVLSGYYTDYQRMAQDAAAQNSKADGVYLIPNAVDPDLLARSANRLKDAKTTTADSDITARRWLLSDFDPRRKAGISSTDAEHQAAITLARQAANFFIGLGTPANSIVLADSGNGAHVLVRLSDLPNDDASRVLVTRILQVLDQNLSDDAVSVDLTTFNAARIWKLYGTVARKGDSTPDRPHRLSRILAAPETVVPTPLEVLQAIASLWQEPVTENAPSVTKSRDAFNLETWLANHDIVVNRKDPYEGGFRYILRECVFDSSHNGTSVAIIVRANGAIGYACKHDHCAEKTWADVRELKEPGYRERQSVTEKGSLARIYRDAGAAESERHKSVTKSVTNGPTETQNVTNVTPETVEEWCRETSAWFSYEELDRELGIRTPEDKHNRRTIIYRLKASGKLESHPRDNKLMRYVSHSVRLIDFKSAGMQVTIPVRYPFGIEDYFKTYPGNIIVVAGAPDAGKTAFLLNFIHLNQSNFTIFYQSSEMGEDELANRLQGFEGIDLRDWSFTAEERSGNFADVIRPDCVNIIDYMEITSEFYMVAENLKAIHDKLRSGIALVAIQKAPGADAGRGGTFGLEKPRLYLNMDSGTLKIRKAKNWTNPKVNPNGLVVNFKTVAGCRFTVTQDWHKETEA